MERARRAKHGAAALGSAGGRTQRAGRDAGVSASRSSAPHPTGPRTALRHLWSSREPHCPQKPKEKAEAEDPRKHRYLGCWLPPLVPRAGDFLSRSLHFCGFLVFYISAYTDTHQESPAAEPPASAPGDARIASPHLTASHPIPSTDSPQTPPPSSRRVGAGVWHIPTLKQLGCPLPRKDRSVQARPRARSGAHCHHTLPDSGNRALSFFSSRME